MLAEITTWWVSQMLDLLPIRWRTGDAGLRSALIIDCGAAEPPVTATCWRRRRRRETAAGQFLLATDAAPPELRRRSRVPVVLRLAMVPLECEVTVPLAAEPEMTRVLQAEIDRLTPFSPADVYWTAAVSRREPSHGRLRSLLTLIPRSTLEPLLGALERHGVTPEALEGVRPDGTIRHIPLRPRRRRGRIVPLLIGGCGALAVAGALATPFLLQDREAGALQRQIAELKPSVDRVQALRQRVVTRSVDVASVLAEQHRIGDTMQVLATLTDLLPDDTFITTLALRQRRLTISGQSAAAAGLIASLSTGTVIRNPAFAAPVVRDPADRTDTFSLVAEVAQ
jgi:general secretion pathway protein L